MTTNAAFSVARAAGKVPTDRPFGKDMANNAFLSAFLATTVHDDVFFYAATGGAAEKYREIVPTLTDRTFRTHFLSQNDISRLAEPGCLMHLDPHLGRDAWDRRRVGQRSFSIVALIHTMAGPFNLDAHMETLLGPVQSWDALVCTSRAVKRTVEMLFERWSDYLSDRFGATRLPAPQLPILPLGVDVARFRRTDQRRAAGHAWRQRLGIAPDALAVLYLGRLSYVEKAHPTPMLIALEQAARQTGRKFHMIFAGWFPTPDHDGAFRAAHALYAPSIGMSIVDGRTEPAKTEIWHAADVFCSMVDNIQETFGLAPVEAMAAGLPCVVSDWDGYRDTVRHGEDGFRIATVMPPAGTGGLLPLGNASLNESFQRYVGSAALMTSVDIPQAATAFATLATNVELRRTMAENAATRAREVFDWPIVMRHYRELWTELADRRRTDAENAPRRENQSHEPRVEDPFRLYGHFATRQVVPEMVVALPPAGTGVAAADIPKSSLNNLADRHFLTPAEQREVLARLARGPQTVRAVLETVPRVRRLAAYRWLGHLLKFDALRIVDA
ncbi:MAG: glycosyltransferase family 4 protein [Alphaproteobacteria bacterium]|nr:glycosyltransferase family 4 protein [Alphaproteobacteria bacterium]